MHSLVSPKQWRPLDGDDSSNSQYELQSGEFAPFGRELSALKPENSPLKAGCFRAGFQNENCWDDSPTKA